MSPRFLTLLSAFLLTPFILSAADMPVTDATINAGETYTMSPENVYILDGLVFVEDGAVLIIEPGTIVKAKPGGGDNATALIIARGGRIMAEGTPEEPIIFTSEADDVNNPDDILLGTNGLWGGVIILGNAGINIPGGEANIEGIDAELDKGKYGGTDNEDNSGVFKYVSIRHGGTKIGPKNEINGLTMGGVGSGTEIHHVEVFNNQDDGFEWFGGTVNCRYLVSAFNGDDAFDYDQGWRGNGQFWFVIQDPLSGDRAGEYDGGDKPNTDAQPYGTPHIYNVTYIGSGADGQNPGNSAMILKENAGGYHRNSIFYDFGGKGIEVEDLESGQDCRQMMDDGMLVLSNNIWYGFGDGNELADIAPDVFVQEHLAANENNIVDPMLGGISRVSGYGLDPRPKAGSAAWENVRFTPENDWFEDVDYIGAFGMENWMLGWTYLFERGILNNVEEEYTPENLVNSDIKLYPNPAAEYINIEFSLKSGSNVNISVYNPAGSLVDIIIDKTFGQGAHGIRAGLSDYAPGAYTLQLKSGKGSVSSKFIVK